MGLGPQCGLVGTGLGRLSFYYRSLLWVGLQVLARCHLHRHWGGIPTILGAPSESEACEALLQPGGGDTPGAGISTAGGSVAALMANLLPQAYSGLAAGSQGVYVGEGLPRYPPSSQQKSNGTSSLRWLNCFQSYGPQHGRMTTRSSRPSPGESLGAGQFYVAAMLQPVHKCHWTPAPIKDPGVDDISSKYCTG